MLSYILSINVFSIFLRKEYPTLSITFFASIESSPLGNTTDGFSSQQPENDLENGPFKYYEH